MLGRCSLQRSPCDVVGRPRQAPTDLFYGFRGSVSDMLSPDHELGTTYCADNGRSSLPLSVMNGMLPFYDDVF